jgi:hypothetical protein
MLAQFEQTAAESRGCRTAFDSQQPLVGVSDSFRILRILRQSDAELQQFAAFWCELERRAAHVERFVRSASAIEQRRQTQ